VIAVSLGYPGTPISGGAIRAIEAAEQVEGVTVFHAGTALEEGRLVTAGGRVLAVSAVAADVAAAQERAYAAAERISFAGMQYRRDIGGRPALLGVDDG
jgi:phosphoribosylamine---glycine ligase